MHLLFFLSPKYSNERWFQRPPHSRYLPLRPPPGPHLSRSLRGSAAMGTRISVNLAVPDEHSAGHSVGATAARRRQRSQLSAVQTLDPSESSPKCGKHKHKQHLSDEDSTHALYAAAVVGTIPLLMTREKADPHEALKPSLSLPLPLATGFGFTQQTARVRKTSAMAGAATSRALAMRVDSALGSTARLPISLSIPELYSYGASRSNSPTLMENDSRFLSATDQQSSQDSSQLGSDARHKRSMYRKSRGGKRSPPAHVEHSQHHVEHSQHERQSHSDHSHPSEHSCCCHSHADSAFRQDSHDGVDYELELSMRRIVRVDVDQITNLSEHLRGPPGPATAAAAKQPESTQSPAPKRSQSTVVEPSLLPNEPPPPSLRRRRSTQTQLTNSSPDLLNDRISDERRSVCHLNYL